MTEDERREAVKRLFELRREFSAGKVREDTPDAIKEMRGRVHEKVREAAAELYVEHFSDEQLNAMLDFYGSELGQSIIETQSLIRDRISERMQDIVGDLNPGSSETSSKSGVGSGFYRSAGKRKPPDDESES